MTIHDLIGVFAGLIILYVTVQATVELIADIRTRLAVWRWRKAYHRDIGRWLKMYHRDRPDELLGFPILWQHDPDAAVRRDLDVCVHCGGPADQEAGDALCSPCAEQDRGKPD